MDNLRIYGRAPFRVAVIHGGPGAAGEVAPVARELSREWGVLEPLQTADSVEGQVDELSSVLERSADLPVTVIGHSWGAMLGFILSARHPAMVRELIMVGSAVFDEEYSSGIMPTRLSRLTQEERLEFGRLERALVTSAVAEKDAAFAALGRLIAEADSYEPIWEDGELMEPSYYIYRSVWGEARSMRSSGRLLELGKRIACPVVAVHGDYDPHPAMGVRGPLSGVIKDFRFIVLTHCGHRPWAEREAKSGFYDVLKDEVRLSIDGGADLGG